MKSTTIFTEKVDYRSRKIMTYFLCGHKRYDTMNSWNSATTWANNLKVYNCIPKALQDKIFEMMDTDDYYYEINKLIQDYNTENHNAFQAGFNGKSGGYLVMYSGYEENHMIFPFKEVNGKVPERDYADGFGWRSINEAKERNLFRTIRKKIGTWAGRSVDDYDREDYENTEEMPMYKLKEIVQRVQKFDTLCDNIVQSVIDLAESCTVVEEEYQVIKKRKIITYD